MLRRYFVVHNAHVIRYHKYLIALYFLQASNNQVENYPVLVNPEGPLYSKAVGIRFKVCNLKNIFIVYFVVAKNV